MPLVFGDKVFDKRRIAYFDLFNLDGIIGDKQTGQRQDPAVFRGQEAPLPVAPLNTGPSRFYQFKFSNGMKFWQVSNDGNLLPKPIERNSVDVTVAEQIDIIVDFSRPQARRYILVNVLEHKDGTGPTGKILNPGTRS